MLDQAKEKNPRIASYVMIFWRRIDSKDKAKSISYFLNLPLRLFEHYFFHLQLAFKNLSLHFFLTLAPLKLKKMAASEP